MSELKFTTASNLLFIIKNTFAADIFTFENAAHINVNAGYAIYVTKINATINIASYIKGGFEAGAYGIEIYGDAVAGDYGNINVSKDGMVLGYNGIKFGPNLDTFTLTNAGHISGTGDMGVGVDVYAQSGVISNTGTIDKIASVSQSLTIINDTTGVINGGIDFDGEAVLHENRNVINKGTLTANSHGVAFDGSEGADVVQNAGLISGNVYLQGGNDLFSYLGKDVGTQLLGAVYGGAGDDQYYIFQKVPTIVEAKYEGFDTINLFSIDKYVLPDDVYVEAVLGDLKSLSGNVEANTVTGGDSANNLFGMGGSDFIQALKGDDFLDGGQGKDTLAGGFGNDTYVVDDAGDFIIENDANSDGIDSVSSTAATFTLAVGVENIALLGSGNIKATGNGSANSMIGNSGANSISGGAGNDVLFGKSGKDILKGDAGSDIIDGGAGIDKLYGGAGADKFIFHPHDTGKTKASADTIYDFATGDRIDLQLIDASTRSGGNQHFTFIGHAGFHHKAGELRYDRMASDTYIYGDMNGDGRADLVIHLDDAKTMSGGNFVL